MNTTLFKIAIDLLATARYWLPLLLVFGVAARVLRRRRWIVVAIGGTAFVGAAIAYLPELDRFHTDVRVYRAAGQGDLSGLKAALDAGGSPNADEPTSGGWPALCAAVESGSAPCVELLLQRGADPDSASWGEGTVLHKARKTKRRDLVALLQRYGAKRDVPGDGGR